MPELSERELTFPEKCNTAQKRLELTCRAQELLRYLHNVFSKWTHKGLTQKEYDEGVKASVEDGIDEDTMIPDKLKALYSYRDGITVAKMEAYIRDEHEPRQAALRIGHARKPFLDDNSKIEALGMEQKFDEEGKRDYQMELLIYEAQQEKLTTWDSNIKIEDI